MIRKSRGVTWLTLVALGGVISLEAFGQTTRPMPRAPTTLPIVLRETWGSTPEPIPDSRLQTPHLITIHHAGEMWYAGSDPLDKARKLQKYGQTQKNWPDIPYHYLIAPDGTIVEARDWKYEPESNTKYPLNGVLNIELYGNFEEQRASVEQLRSLVGLIVYLKRDVGLDLPTEAIRGHRDAATQQTVCPGKDFYRYISNGSIRRWVEESLAGETPDIRLLDALPAGPTTMIFDTTRPTP